MNALAGKSLYVESIKNVDFLFEGLQRHQRFAELHRRTLTLGTPMILVDAAAEKHYAKPLRKGRRRRRIGKSIQGCKPRQGHRTTGSAKDGAAGYASGILFRMRHLTSPFCVLVRIELFRACPKRACPGIAGW